MKKLFAPFMIIIALGLCQGALAQTQSPAPELKHFAAHGLSFDYPATIELDNRSSTIGQHLVIQSKGQAQIMIVSRFARINNAEELAAAKREVVDSFIDTLWKQIQESDPNVSRADTQIEVGGARASGVRLRAVLNNEPGNAEVYSVQLGSRLVLLSLIGTDREIAASAAAWLAIRRSLKIEITTISALRLRSDAKTTGLIQKK